LEVIGLLFSLIVVTPIVAMLFIGIYWSRTKDDHRLAGVWQAYARKRGHTFGAPSGAWPNRTPPTIEWIEKGDVFRIEARGLEAIASTQVIARPTVAALGELLVTPSTGEASRREGAVPLDGRLVVWAQPAGFADRILTLAVKRALLGFHPQSLTYRRGEVSLAWAGGEENDARLDEASAVVRRILDVLAEVHRSGATETSEAAS